MGRSSLISSTSFVPNCCCWLPELDEHAMRKRTSSGPWSILCYSASDSWSVSVRSGSLPQMKVSSYLPDLGQDMALPSCMLSPSLATLRSLLISFCRPRSAAVRSLLRPVMHGGCTNPIRPQRRRPTSNHFPGPYLAFLEANSPDRWLPLVSAVLKNGMLAGLGPSLG
jgi:hypothetical protein